MPELAFLMPNAGDGPSDDLAAALCEEVGRQDAVGVLCAGALPEPRPDRVYVVLDGAGEGGGDVSPDPSRTVVVLLAPPGTDRFDRGVELARRAGAVFHVNAAAVESLLELGVPARHLQLGYSAAWEGSDAAARPEVAIVRDTHGYFDWPAALRAIHGGSVVLHERALGLAPMVAERHLFVADPDALDPIATALLRDPDRLEEVRREALGFLRDALPLARAAAALIGAARVLVAQPLPSGTDSTPGHPASMSK